MERYWKMLSGQWHSDVKFEKQTVLTDSGQLPDCRNNTFHFFYIPYND